MLDEKYPNMDDLLSDPDVASDYIEKSEELARLRRIDRCSGDLLEFGIEYFSEARNPGNDGNWDGFDVKNAEEAPEFHKNLTQMMNVVATDEINAKVVAAVARSHGKSTWLSKAFPVSEIVYRNRKYVILISETPTVATANMEWIRNQLKYNVKLRNDFGELLSQKDQSNITDNGEAFIAWHSDDSGGKKQVALMQAASTGQALRGRNWNGSRPDLVIMDDLEDARPGGNASTPEQRAKLKDWMSQTVMPLGDPAGKKTAFVVMGTTVHASSLLMTIIHERSDFTSQVYRAIINEPKRMDLWNECRAIYVDRDNSNRAEDARQYYEDNREAMDEGVKVLWEEFQPIWMLMTWKWNNGSKAFNTEFQNNPVDPESQIFNPENFTYYDGEIDYKSDRYSVALGVDPAMGKQRGDFSAIAVTAKDKETGTIYVLDSIGERIKPDVLIQRVVQKVLEYQPTVIAAEAVAAQEFIVDEMKKELVKHGYPANTRVKKIYHRSRKGLRIEAMLPSIENGTIQFKRNHALLLEQFEQYGTGSHDDTLDALEFCVSALSEGEAVVRTVRRMNRW